MKLLRRLPPSPMEAFLPFEEADVEQSIPQRFAQMVQAHGDDLAIKWERRSYTYAQLDATANRLARALLQRGGREPEPVALLFEHGGETLAAIMAVLKAGKCYMVLDAGNPADRLKYMLQDSGAKLMVADADSHAYGRELCGSTIELLRFGDTDTNLPDADPGAHPAPTSLAMIMYTSGRPAAPRA